MIVDNHSDDGTTEIAGTLGAKCIQQNWLGFGKQKQTAVDLCPTDWILALDADEELTKALRFEIQSLTLNDPSQAYEIKRLSFFLGRPVRFSGWQKDYVVRLFNRKEAYFTDRLVHEKVTGYKKKNRLKSFLKHYPYQSIEDVERKITLYSDLGSKELFKARTSHAAETTILAKACYAFFRTFLVRQGFLDGFTGLQISIMNARTTYLKYRKFNQLLEKSST